MNRSESHYPNNQAVILTIRDRCRRCYACIRNCPAKAIRVRDGQASVLSERCIACGRCVNVCSQGAKQVTPRASSLRELFKKENDVVALVAPSFPAAFPSARPGQVVAALRHLGFSAVYEVGFGADLVSRAYRRLYDHDPHRLWITSPCPGAYVYIEKYLSELVPFLAPVLSPMAATGKALKEHLRPGCTTVFVGPCTAKLRESYEVEVAPFIDLAMVFSEIRAMLAEEFIATEAMDDESFTPPHSRQGALYPIPGGLLHVSGLSTDFLATDCTTVVGRDMFTDTAERLRKHILKGTLPQLDARFFDVLFCNGCIAGPDMQRDLGPLMKRQRITGFLQRRVEKPDLAVWERAMADLEGLDLGRSFVPDAQVHLSHSEKAIREVLMQTGKKTPDEELNCGACGYHTCREKATAVLDGVAELEMCLPFLVERLQAMIQKLNRSHDELNEAQRQLLRSERLASMGQLAAGIAHELNNPLGTILIYAHLLQEYANVENQTREDAEMILGEATRCKTIVSGLLDFARQNKVSRQLVDIRSLVEEAIKLIRVQDTDDQVAFSLDGADNLPAISIDPDQMKQVFVNLLRNAFDAQPSGGKVVTSLWVDDVNGDFHITIADDGPGISPENMHKLFSPFFTTKPVGRGMGLGLPICYGIVKMHSGTITARNNPSGGACFEICLPQVTNGHVDHNLS